jgi:hypothetical protein
MDSKSLSHAQIETIKESVRARGEYFKRLADRMVANGFVADDTALKATREAHEKIQALWVRLNCLSLEAFTREFDAAERRIKRSRRMGKRTFW